MHTVMHNNSITLSETSNMLTVSILTESNLGVYCCEVTNSAGLSGSNTTTIELGGEYYKFVTSHQLCSRLYIHNGIMGFNKFDLQENDYTYTVRVYIDTRAHKN